MTKYCGVFTYENPSLSVTCENQQVSQKGTSLQRAVEFSLVPCGEFQSRPRRSSLERQKVYWFEEKPEYWGPGQFLYSVIPRLYHPLGCGQKRKQKKRINLHMYTIGHINIISVIAITTTIIINQNIPWKYIKHVTFHSIISCWPGNHYCLQFG